MLTIANSVRGRNLFSLFDVQRDENEFFKLLKSQKPKALRLMALMRLLILSSFVFGIRADNRDILLNQVEEDLCIFLSFIIFVVDKISVEIMDSFSIKVLFSERILN